jgi:chaperonin cofactor prefoldin
MSMQTDVRVKTLMGQVASLERRLLELEARLDAIVAPSRPTLGVPRKTS